MAGELRIWLLGGFRAAVDGCPVEDTAWRRSKARALVKLLALAPGHRLHREEVIESLWPAQDAAAGGASLRKAVHFARRALGPAAVRAGDLLELAGDPLWIDTEEFERETDPELRALLYTGDLLPEDRYEAWADEARQRLRARHVQALLDLAAEREAGGDLRGAAAALEHAAAGEPLSEEAHLALVRVHALAGRRSRALSAYDRYAERLAVEVGAEPGEAARQLRKEVEAGRLPPNPAPAEPHAAPRAVAPDERKLVTVVSVAVAPATDAGPVDPERARPRIEAGLTAAASALGARGARVERSLGDLVIGIFGVPAAHEDDARRALEAADEALRGASAAGAELQIGIDTGEVLVREGAALGEPLRSASRLRELAAPGTFEAGARTREAARRSGLSAAALVGRDTELAALRTFHAEVVERARPRLVLILGPAGIGKSRLLAETLAILAGESAWVLRGRCLTFGQGITHGALAEVLREAAGIQLRDRPREVEAKLRRAVAGAVAERDLASTIDALAAGAGIVLGGRALSQSEASAAGEELALAWPRYLSGLAAQGPCVLAIEDLHWAGEGLLATLERVVARSTGPLLVLATARPELAETHPGFGGGSEDFSTLSLRPLTAAQSAELLGGLAAGRGLSPSAAEEVVARADGNPYFLEELAQHIAEASPAALPDTIHSLLSARVDALPAFEKQVLQEAAVVGRTFWAAPVAAGLGADIEGALHELERRGLIVRRAASAADGELAFKHALLREVVYASIPLSRRARVHARAAAWLEEVAADRLGEVAEPVAHHYAAAADEDPALRPRAFESLVLAGRSARRRFAAAEAVVLHRRALDFAAGDADRLRALEALGDDFESGYRGEEATAAYEEALAIARARPEHAATRGRLCSKLAGLMAHSPGAFRTRPDPRRCDELIAEGMAHAGDEETSAYLSLVVAEAARLWRGSEPYGQGAEPDPVPIEERVAAAERALEAGRRLGHADLQFRAAWALSIAYGIAGRFDAYLRLSRRQLADLEGLHSRLQQGDVLRQAAAAELLVAGDLETALTLGLRGHALAVDTNPHQAMHATWPVLAALYWLGRWEEMRPFIDHHLANHRQDPADECSFVREGPVIGAVMLAQSGDADAARSLAAEVPDPRRDIAGASSWQARLAVALGDPELGRRISADKAGERRAYGPEHALSLLEALVALADWNAVAAFLPTARRAAAGNALLRPWADRAEGLAARAAGREAAARVLLRRAAAGFAALKAAREAEASARLARE